MELYREDGDKLVINKGKKIGNGNNGTVYQMSDGKCLKIYRSSAWVNVDTLKIIKDMKFNNYYKIYDMLYDKDSNFKGMIMKYYPQEEVNVLMMEKNYLLDNVNGLGRDILSLIEKGIFIVDLNIDNTIINRNGITVIDADLYIYREDYDRDLLGRMGYATFRSLVKSIIVDSISMDKSMEDVNIYKAIVENLVGNPFDTKSMEKKLVRCKYPMEYIKRSL